MPDDRDFGTVANVARLPHLREINSRAKVSTLFLQLSFANHVATDWANDLLISASVFFIFAAIELKRLGSSRLGMLLYVGLTFGVGLSCALPLFLYRREQLLERNAFR